MDLQKLYGVPAVPLSPFGDHEACAPTAIACTHTYLRKTDLGYYCLDCRETIGTTKRVTDEHVDKKILLLGSPSSIDAEVENTKGQCQASTDQSQVQKEDVLIENIDIYKEELFKDDLSVLINVTQKFRRLLSIGITILLYSVCVCVCVCVCLCLFV